MGPIHGCLEHAHLSLSYWNYALSHVIFCRNLSIHNSTGQIPFSHLIQELPHDVINFRPFGCRVLVEIDHNNRKKIQPRLVEGINLGHKQRSHV